MKEDKAKKKILHLLFSGLGGHGSVFFSLVEADPQREYDYSAVFCGIEDIREEYRNSCQRLEIPYVFVPKKRGLKPGVYGRLFRAFRKYKPDTIFLHGVSFLMPAVWYKIFNPGARIIVRDTQAHHLKSKQEWFWFFFCLFFAKKIVLLSEASAQGVRKKFGRLVRRDKLVIIPNGMNLSRYQPAYQRNTGEELKVGMQSRLQPIKDHPTLLRAFRNVRDRHPGTRLSLHIAGDGETMPQVRSMIDELGLQKDVHLYGMLNEKELLDFMHNLDIYVHATFGEMMSNSIMQAMACGLPLIASDVWGVNNMITHEGNGLLYREKDVEQLAGQLEEMILNQEKRIRLGSCARQFAEENYSNRVMFDRYKALY